jgi:RND family efflux transporter MFP subunit
MNHYAQGIKMRLLHSLILITLLLPALATAQEMPPAQVIVTKVVQEEIAQNQSMIGTLYYERVSHVSSELAGLVAEVHIREGDHIKQGAPVIILNTEILDLDIKLTKTRIDQIALRIEKAEKNFKRLERLYAKEGVSEKDYEDALYSFQDLSKEKLATEANLQKLLVQKKRSNIKAPFDGLVLSKNVDLGDWIQQGKEIVTIGSTNDLFVQVPVGETMLRHITIGDSVPVNINAFDRDLTGTIHAIAPKADPQTKNIFLKVKIPAQKDIAENMSATIFVAASAQKMLAIIPRDALIKFQGKDFVYTVKEGKAAILPVNIVAFLGQRVGVDNPYIVPGMPVVIEGNERLRPDQAVVVAGEK